MGLLDIILIICFIPSLIIGISKGLVKQLFSLAAVFVALTAAIHFAPEVGKWLGENISGADGKFANVVAFTAILVFTVLAMKLIGCLLTKLVSIATLGWANRLAGGLFGIVKAALILMILIFIFEEINGKWQIVEPGTLSDSHLYMYLKNLSDDLFPKLKELATNINV